ncbi:MAG: hypothetical protein Q8P18_30910 [Pseudomonadota bacterium]|nr:hypothetical protein [Pseudomonadota bacterium]
MAVVAAWPLPTCAVCVGDTKAWEVRAAAGRVSLDRDGVRAGILAGTLNGSDLVLDGAASTPIAAHAAFRTLFLPGHPDALPVRPEPTVGSGKLRRVPVMLGVGVVLAVALGLSSPYVLPELTAGGSASTGTKAAAVAAPVPSAAAEVVPPPAAPVVAAQPLDPIGELVKRVGPVESDGAALLAEARDARLLATPEGLLAAIGAGERAVAHAPQDPDALALLAGLLAEAGMAPQLRTALLVRAISLQKDAPAVHRAVAEDALARSDIDSARLSVDACLRVVPTDLGCRELHGRVIEAGSASIKEAEATNLVYALDELTKAWPENRHLPRRAALLAARADLTGAEGRLAAERKRFPADPALQAASALLSFRNGAPTRARALLRRLEAPPDALLVEAAGEAVGRGAPDEALALLARVQAAAMRRDARLYEAQARWLLARAGKGSAAEASAAAERVAALDPGHPAVVQVRVALASLANDPTAAARAWEQLQTGGAQPVDIARAWVARAALNVAQHHPREALLEVESALQADGSAPEVHLWRAAAQASGQNGAAAVDALRAAITAIDGRHARRRTYGGALVLPADIPALRTALTTLLQDDPARRDDLALANAVLDWLGGDAAAASAALVPLVQRGADADALALDARLLLAAGQPKEALARMDQAVALRPREVAWQLVRAEALLALRKVGDAEVALASARSGKVPVTTLQLLVGEVAAKKGDTAAALVARRAAVAADPTDLGARRALRGVTED